MFIDTHCHLEKEFYGDINNVIEENRKAGVYKIIVSGCSKEEIVEVLEYAHMYDDVYLTVGFHPEFSETVKDSDINWLKEIIKSNPKVVGIGEIGLDYHYDGFDKEVQKEVFEKQLKLASELNLPVVIHSRDACEDTINILKKYDLKGDIHCFSGSLETAKIYIKMGYYLGIGGVVTFKNSKLRETIKGISLNDILLETDSPYLTPAPYRGTLNSSKYIPLIAQEVANSFDVSLSVVEKNTTQNAIELFSLK
ncbi:MAG: TatD family hydrolase [Bacilli bacterium]|nr:TatD family hydrolase [Bacilli bacterium]